MPEPHRTVAKNLGISKRKANLYDSSDGSFSFDPVLTQGESVIGFLEGICALVFSGRPVPAGAFLVQLAPFIAGLLVRHPDLALDGASTLGALEGPSSLNEVLNRQTQWHRVLDRLVYNTRWRLIERIGPPLVTSDLGFLWLPGTLPGTLHIPLHPHAMLELSPGRSYYFGDKEVWIEAGEWDHHDWLVSQLALMYHAPNELYGSDPEYLAAAREMMVEDGPVEVCGIDISVLGDARGFAFFAAMYGSSDPHLAFHRVHLAQEQFSGCTCEEELETAPFSARQRAAFRSRMKVVKDIAPWTIPRRSIVSPLDLELTLPYRAHPLQLR